MQGPKENGDISASREAFGGAEINNKLIVLLRNLSHQMRALYEGRGSQRRILIVLEENGGGMTQRELTERLGIQPGSASEVIAKLESAGYIRRAPSPSDRRTADITLTAPGTALAQEAKEQRLRRHAEMFSCLSGEEKEKLLFLLEKINADWEERYQGIGENHGRCGHHRRNHWHPEKPNRPKEE